MKCAPLPPADRTLLDDDLAIHAQLQTQVDVLEKIIVADNAANPLAHEKLGIQAGEARRIVTALG